MPIPHRALYLWPGLSQLWLRGCWWGMAIAVVFTALVNFVLAATFMWPLWIEPSIVVTGWVAVLVTWFVGVFAMNRMSASAQQTTDDLRVQQNTTANLSTDSPSKKNAFLTKTIKLFQEAQRYYLRRDWLEAERKLNLLLEFDPLDTDAQIMIAAVYRRTNRPEQSRRALRYLARMDNLDKWQWEIKQERKKLNYMEQGGKMDQPDSFLEAA